MQQIKLFKGVENEIAALQDEINAWLAEGPKHIVSMTGNIAPQSSKPQGGGGLGNSCFAASDILVMFLYDDQDGEHW